MNLNIHEVYKLLIKYCDEIRAVDTKEAKRFQIADFFTHF